MTFLLPGAAAPPVHRIPNALRLRASNSAFLSRTPSVASSQTRATASVWLKRGTLGTDQAIFSAGTDGNRLMIAFDPSDGLRQDDSGIIRLVTTDRFRDPTAHLHLVWRVDTHEATASNRIRFYVNNRLVTSFSTNAGMPGQGASLPHVNTAVLHTVGRGSDGGRFFDGLMSAFHFVDGQSLEPSAFGRVDPATGAWVPIRYTGSYGANGFHLPFNDAVSTTMIGQDRSGNGNHWTSSGISVTAGATFDQMLDTPTNNHATFNPLASQSGVLDSANMRGGFGGMGEVTQWVSSGKPYAELTIDTMPAYVQWGVGGVNYRASPADGTLVGNTTDSYALELEVTNNYIRNNSVAVAAGLGGGSAGVVLQIALDMDNNRVWFGRNNTFYDNGNPGAGTSPTYTGLPALVRMCFGSSGASGRFSLNTGQRPFVYTPPSGFGALNTANLPATTIRRGDEAFEVLRYQGNGSTSHRAIQGAKFQGALAWFKDRANAARHTLVDDARGGAFPSLASNTDMSEVAEGEFVSFDPGGVTVKHSPAHAYLNNTSLNCVTWLWRKGAAYGFDIVTYVGNGVAGRNVAHGLNAVPHMMIVKCRSGGWTWRVYHRAAAALPQNGDLRLSQTGAFNVSSAIWNNTPPGGSSFTVGNDPSVNSNGDNLVAYLWTSIPGFSLFGSYAGNGSADGPFVWCGFRPRFVMVKRIDGGATNWHMRDSARSPFNLAQAILSPNVSDAEVTSTGESFDFTANGFKLRSASSETNASGFNYIFAAFAETPFKFANAR